MLKNVKKNDIVCGFPNSILVNGEPYIKFSDFQIDSEKQHRRYRELSNLFRKTTEYKKLEELLDKICMTQKASYTIHEIEYHKDLIASLKKEAKEIYNLAPDVLDTYFYNTHFIKD